MTTEFLMLFGLFGVISVTQLARLARCAEGIGAELSRLRKMAEDRKR